MSEKYKFKTGLTIGMLKDIIKDMSDDAIVSARDRDCINLCEVHVVNHPTIKSIVKTGKQFVEEGKINYKGYEHYKYYEPVKEFGNTKFVVSMSDVYGGIEIELDNHSKQAIIFCDCD